MCHQTVGLTARHLESTGMPTLILGSARDILDEVGVPRFAFTDLPLGNSVGPANDPAQQLRVLRDALVFAEGARHPRSSVMLDVVWRGPDDWRDTYMSTEDTAALLAAGDARRNRQHAARGSAAQSAS